ncbi:MAG TPA: RecQ family ATP-dependent DNA helicase, partial [Ignavibacteriales bacterium]|nr:RecQ family ATP-dependent DNA helicase [Ignavibacteriales bacterium]
MKDQTDSLNKNGKIATFINSSLGYRETEEVFSQLSSGKIKLLYVAPERLESQSFLERIKNFTPDYLFVDEAHCISEWGHNFRPSYQRIRDFAELISLKRISAFTATATPEVIEDIQKQLNLISPKIYVKGFERDNILIKVIQTSRNKEALLELITKHRGPAIVYASSRKNAEEAAGYLKAGKVNAEFYHAGLTSIERKRIQELFIEDKIDTICATNAFGMGIDKPNIRLIVHYNMPGNIESYYQEIGRAGRDGKISRAFLLYNASDISIHKFFINNAYPTREQVGTVYNLLCDSAGIPLGKVNAENINIETGKILKHFNRGTSPAIILSALRVLETSGYIKIINAFEGKAVLKIDYSQESLKSYIKNYAGDTSKEIIISLLREFGGSIFNSRTEFLLSGFAKKLELSEDILNRELSILAAAGIISYYAPSADKSAKLLQPRVPSGMLIINYDSVAERMRRDFEKLNKMTDFVYTSECRFKYIINYFGEKNEDYKCGSCDNCAGDNFNKAADIEYLREIVIRTVNETKGKLSGMDIISLLLGKTGNVYLTSYSDYGSCSNYNESEVQAAFDSAIGMEYISKGHTLGAIMLTDKGLEFLKKAGYIEKENKSATYEYNLEL